MCGRFKLKPDNSVDTFLETLGVAGALRYAPDIAPTSTVSIIRHAAGKRQIDSAIWWLLLNDATLKPSNATSFNSRSDRLNDKNGKTYHLYRRSRCLIPASAFIESHTELVSKNALPGAGPVTSSLFPEDILESSKVEKTSNYMIELEDRAIAFGGLYKEYRNAASGEVVLSCSIITLPPLAAWAKIHADSMPLLIDYTDQSVVDSWLDPDFSDVESFTPLLVPRVSHRQRITPIGKVSQWNPVGPSFSIQPV